MTSQQGWFWGQSICPYGKHLIENLAKNYSGIDVYDFNSFLE